MARPRGPGDSGGTPPTNSDGDGTTPRHRSSSTSAGSVADGQRIAAEEAHAGRAPGSRTGTGWPDGAGGTAGSGTAGSGTDGAGTGWPEGDGRGEPADGADSDPVGEQDSSGDRDNLLTQPTGEEGGEPSGRPTRINPRDDYPTRRSLEMENSAAARLAAEGYRVEQNPSPQDVAQARQNAGDAGLPQKRPDYLIEGRVFDAYSPTASDKAVHYLADEVQAKIVKGQTQRVVVNLEDWRGDVDALRRHFHDSPVPNLKELKIITPEGGIIQVVPE
ncbi:MULTISPECIES: CdiA C-terminal domain-containing protein [Catenuloplanes]|uniref:tRNA nuclease CdiA C-terminal domain-containing protein n=1 Tax=Catenuloplanes niger TaxID=587534 RepID=A0AAE3ZUZ7_9ACTN|nr:hypothetical protein [Catenuloplanes niger]